MAAGMDGFLSPFVWQEQRELAVQGGTEGEGNLRGHLAVSAP